jgi:hypothetical protein
VTALQTVTVTDKLAIAAGSPSVGPDMQQLWRRFPPRAAATTWPVTERRRELLLAELLAASALVDKGRAAQQRRRLGLTRLMDWLADQSGHTWQQRWVASGADAAGNADWWQPMLAWARPAAPHLDYSRDSGMKLPVSA